MAKRPPAKNYEVRFKWDSGLDKFIVFTTALSGELAPIATKAMKKATLMALTEITDRIRAGRYKKLAPLTGMMRSLDGYGQTPLIRSGALLRAITKDVLGPYSGVVGINKNARGKRGRDKQTGKFTSAEIANIAETLHEGARIKITPEMKQAFARRMRAALKKNGGGSMLQRRGSSKGVIRIPPRPFIKAVFEDDAFVRKVEELFWSELYKNAGIGRS